ncbi:MAG TPA: 4a-hydroxytetrahydrobiopterin dehydratase [Candidatus Paceibacterota bacterium]|nr:4a-hydroxytetrahydrobiopterin dehydratase [Candidatus Paceibacterota bacterium]
MANIYLTQKHCIPCEAGTPPLTKTQAEEYLKTLSGWDLVEGSTKLQKEYVFTDFKEALEFVNTLGEIAEAEGHHPDIFLHDYKRVMVMLSTHAIGGLSENDFILAAKADEKVNR